REVRDPRLSPARVLLRVRLSRDTDRPRARLHRDRLPDRGLRGERRYGRADRAPAHLRVAIHALCHVVRHGDEQRLEVIARRIAPVIACVAVFYAIFVPLRLVQRDALWFVHTGRAFGTAAHSSPYLSGLRRDAAVGYDGEFYFAV